MADTKKREVIVEEVDLAKGLPWKGTAVDVDPSEDAWERGAPPMPAVYPVVLALQNVEFVKYDPTDESRWGYNINIEGRIQEGENDNVPVFTRVSTFINRGKATSTAIGALVKLGYADKIPKQTTPSVIANALCKLLQKGPSTSWELNWRAGFKDDKTGKWKQVCNRYEDFPPDGNGGRMHSFQVSTGDGGKTIISAQLTMVDWIGKGEQPKKAKTTRVSASDLELEDDSPAPVATGGKVGKAKPAPVEEDELDLV